MTPIRNYEDQYFITYEGQIFRKERPEQPLKYVLNPINGYLYVSLRKENKGSTFSVHRLVATHFKSKPTQCNFVNHIDGDKTNPHGDNLEWVTRSDNMLHAYELGLLSQEHRKNLKDFELENTFYTFLSGVSLTDIAASLGIGLSRFSINLRAFATKKGWLGLYNEELEKQKRLRQRSLVKINKENAFRVSQYTPEGVYINTYNSLQEAARSLGKKSSGTISNALNPDHPQKLGYGYLWKLV